MMGYIFGAKREFVRGLDFLEILTKTFVQLAWSSRRQVDVHTYASDFENSDAF